MKPYSYFLFDADGTLIDTVDLIVKCFEHSCSRFGGLIVPAREIRQNIGLTLRNQMELYFGKLTDERFEIIRKEHMDFQLRHYAGYLRAFPGVVECLAALKSGGKRLAVVTSRRRLSLDLYFKETKLFGYFDAFVTADDTLRHKPDPEPALVALSLLGGSKDEALFIGDSRFDIECATNAGIDSALVKWSGSDPSEMAIQPTFCIGDLRQLSSSGPWEG
jgi:pyrophosphatase PpaX